MGEYINDVLPWWIMNTPDMMDIYVQHMSWVAISPVCANYPTL